MASRGAACSKRVAVVFAFWCWQLVFRLRVMYTMRMILTEPLPFMLREARRSRLAESPLLAEAVRWFEHCRMLRAFENEHLLVNPKPEDLNAHRVVISDLIADGEIMAWQARQSSTNLQSVGFQVEDIGAEVRLLRDSLRMFHEPMPIGEAERILEATFGQSAT